MWAGIASKASQHPKILRQIILMRKIHHDTSLGEISNLQRDVTNVKHSAEPEALDLNETGDINQYVGLNRR
jgi:hypothetical protein